MAEESTRQPTLTEQLDSILLPLGVRREEASSSKEHLDEELDLLLQPLGVRRETSSGAGDRPTHEEEEGPLHIRLFFFSVLCEWPDAPRIKERLEQVLTDVEAPSVNVLPGISQGGRCYFMIVATAPFPPVLLAHFRALQEVHDSFDFSTILYLGTDDEESDGEASGV